MVKRPTTRGILLGGMPFLAGCVLWAGVHFGVGGPAAGRGKEIFEQEQGRLWAKITTPAAGALVAGRTPVSLEVGPGINRVEFETEEGIAATVVDPPFGWVWDTRSGPDGARRVTVRAYGAGGAPVTSDVSVTVDNTPPRVSLSPLSPPLTAASTVEVSATAEDANGVARLVFSLDGTARKTVMAPPFAWAWAVGVDANGSHRVTAEAYDRAGNRASVDAPFTVDIDDQNPAVSLSIPGIGSTLVENQTLSITATASDNVGVAKVWFVLDDVVVATVTAGSPYVYHWTISSSQNGVHLWTARAFDAMGNQATTPADSVTVAIDATNPTIALTAPLAGATYGNAQTVDITATASDNVGVAKVWFVLDDVVVATVTAGSPFVYRWAITSADNGMHRWTATAFDTTGNRASTPPLTVTANVPVPPEADRTSQTYLFQMVRQPYPHALAGGSNYNTDWRGPTNTYVDLYSGWKWTHTEKGDWIDLNGTPQGGTPFTSFNANSGNMDQFFTYTGVDVTALVQYAQTHNRWLAVIMDISGPGYRKIATIWNKTTAVPSIAVTYADATVGTLACRLVGVDGGGSSYPHTVEDEETVPAFLEFDRPAKAVMDARLTVSLKRYFNTASNVVSVNLCNPPFNTDPVTGLNGLASQAGNLDLGITGIPGVIGAQRYVDGSAKSDFVYGQSVNIGAEKNYDPALWGGAQDLTKLPHTQVGKWVCGGLVENLSFVDSGYSGEGFQPLAPGLGALKLVMPDSGIQTGQEGGSSGTAASNAYLFMPFEEMGRLDHIFVRQYVRFESPFIRTPDQRREVRQGGLPAWTEMGGKFGISPSHNVSSGGFSGTSGGGHGWQMRWAISECEANLGGPDEQGVQLGWHLYDFGPNNPPGYKGYGGQEQNNWGQRGGLGAVVYGGRWYCIETEVKLNSVNAADSSWQADGVLRTWIDGRLVFERTGLVFRTLPLTPSYPANPELMRPFRELGVGWLLWNWFNGGTTQSTVKRTAFTTGLVWAKQRIGPMKMP